MLIDKLRFLRTFAADGEAGAEGGGDKTTTADTGTKTADAGTGDATKTATTTATDTGGDTTTTTTGKTTLGSADTGAEKASDPISLALSDEVRAALLASLPENDRDPAGKFLKTRSSIPDLLKAGLGADKKISQLTAELKGAVKPISDKATPEEVAAYRKAMGVPDKPEGYKPYRPEGVPFTDADKAVESRILARAHALHTPQSQISGLMQEYYDAKAEETKATAERFKAAAEAGVSELHGEFGKEFQPNMNLADRFLGEMLGPDLGDEWQKIMKTPFADGRTMATMPGFVKGIVRMAKAHYDDGVLDMGGDGTVDVDAEIKKITAKVGTEEYEKPETQTRLDTLIAIQNKRKSRAA